MTMSVKSWLTSLLAVTMLSAGATAGLGHGTWRRALRLYENGMYQQAQVLFEAMPRDALTEGYAVLCAVKLRTDDYVERFDDYRLRYPASTLSGPLHFEHGRILFDAGKYRQAATEFGFVSMDDLQEGELPEYVFKCGYSAFALGRYAEAAQFFSLLESLPQTDFTPAAR